MPTPQPNDLAWIAFWAATVLGFLGSRLIRATDTTHRTKGPSMPDTTTSRPRPLRVAAALVGGLTSLVAGLVGAGLLGLDQGTAVTGLIQAAVAAIGAFGFVIATERKVTPNSDPQTTDGRPLVPATPATGDDWLTTLDGTDAEVWD